MHTKKKKHMKPFILSICTILTLSLSAFSQDTYIKDPSLQQLIKAAIEHFPRIKELEEQLNVNDVKAQLIQSNFMPTASADANYRFQAPVPKIAFGANSIRFQPYNNVSGGVTLNQLIYDFGKTKSQLERNQKEKNISLDNIDNTRNAIAFQVVQLYYSLIFTQQAINVQQAQVLSLKSNEQLVDAKVKNGDALEYDLLNTQVRTTNAENRLKELQGNLENNFAIMEWLTGMAKHSIKLNNSIQADLPLIKDSSNWQQTHPEAKLIQRRIELQELEKNFILISGRPSLFASVNGGFRNGFPTNVDQIKPSGYAGVGLSLPILSPSRPKLQQKLADINIATQRKSLTTIGSGIQKDLKTIQQNYLTHTENHERAKITVAAAKKAYDLALVRYKEGVITNTELLLIQTQVEEAQLNVLQYEFQQLMDKIESHKVIGSRLY